MNPTAMFFAALILLPAAGLLAWAWFAMAKVQDDLRSFDGFEGMHFEIGPQAANHTMGAKWPTPG